ncbi:MAG: hypothetical protein COA43_02200 [Robiginitomaculum sp.]|nr:MAG: hypothetical protein COA43_02200 [Robiginitomaculum sp.]
MKRKNNMFKNNSKIWPLIGVSLLVAAWLISGEDILQRIGAPEKIISALVNAPAILVFVWIITGKSRCYIDRS